MELKDVLLARRSIRKFTDEKVSEEDIEILLHAAMSGPSAYNKTPWEFYVVSDKKKLDDLHSATRFTSIDATLAIVVCGNLSKTLPLQLSEFWVQDASAATENILLAAVDRELGAVWCGIYPQKMPVKKVKEVLGLPEKHIPLNIVYIGYPAEKKEARDQYDEKKVHKI